MNAPSLGPAIRTTCPYCGVGCGVLARADGFGCARIEGDAAHPANFGRLCSKGSALGETLSLDGRLLHPMRRDTSGGLSRIGWDEALGRVAEGFRATIARHGPGSVAFYVSGQLLTEDYYVANKLMKGFIGSGNIDTNSRLCMASSVAGHRRAFGSDTVPGCYEDLDTADLLVLTGSNAAWCHPVLFQRMVKNRAARGARLVVIDPRRTATAEEADLVLQIAPGTDAILFSGLLAHLAANDAIDRRFVMEHTDGFAEALARARHLAPDAEAVALRCDVPLGGVERFFDWFRTTERAVTLYSQGINQSAQGTDKVNAILNCHLATGRIGRMGMGPFSLTGQPNAMGGREAGGLANQLAAHMGFEPESVDRVGRFWNSEATATAPGLKAVDLFDAIAAGRIKALWVMATNPAVSLPRADAVGRALASLDFLVVSEVMQSTDTIANGAHLLLPASAWGEKDGTVTNSERRISRQRAFLASPGEARPDWWVVSEVARRMGFGEAFDYQSPADIFREHAALSGFENDGARDFDIGALAEVSDEGYDTLAPFQWPKARGAAETQRLFEHGGFFTPDRRARMVAIDDPALATRTAGAYPLLLNTGRVRDHWHTMTRTGKSPRLCQHVEVPFVSVHPGDAKVFSLADGSFARVSTLYGSAVLKVSITDRQRQGEIFAPIHWNGETASDARIGALVQPATDPISGQPELKATPVSLSPVSFQVSGFLLSRHAVSFPQGIWWSRIAVHGGDGYRLALDAEPSEMDEIGRRLLGSSAGLVELSDPAAGRYRAALVDGDRLETCLFLASNEANLPSWDWLKTQLASPVMTEAARRALLAGRIAGSGESEGPVVCACFGVGSKRICGAAERGEAKTAEDIGRLTKAGTNCGSCLPEIRRLVTSHHREDAHEPSQPPRENTPI